MLVSWHRFLQIFCFETAGESRIDLVVRLGGPQNNFICQRRLSLNLDQFTERVLETIITPVNSLDLKSEAHISHVFSFGSNHDTQLIKRFSGFYIDCSETLSGYDQLVGLLEEVMVSLIVQIHGKVVLFAVPHKNGVKNDHVPLSSAFEESFRNLWVITEPVTQNLRLIIRSVQSHLTLREVLQNHLMTMLHIVHHRVNHGEISFERKSGAASILNVKVGIFSTNCVFNVFIDQNCVRAKIHGHDS